MRPAIARRPFEPENAMRLIRNICLLLIAALAMPLLAQDFTPYIAKVTGDSVRVRSGASLAHPPVCVMKDGDEVTVLAEIEGWATIRLPADAPCWISADFVQASSDGKTWSVTGDKVNLRVSPDTKYFPVGQAEKESTLTAVIDGQTGKAAEKDGYVQVVPPASAHGAIAIEFVTKLKNVAPEKADEAPRPDEAPKTDNPAGAEAEVKRDPSKEEIEDERKTFKELVTMLEDEIKKPAADVNLAGIRKMFEQFKEFSLEKTTSEEAGRYIEKIDLTLKVIESEKARIAKDDADRKAEMDRIAKEATEKPVEREQPKGPVEYLVTGTVGATGKTAKTPASHRLFDDEGKVLYDLRWDKGDLSKLMGSKVGIVGTVKKYDGWTNEVIVIERIDVLEEDEDK
jgi:uncharacterized protein YgiM (DUF1202 family)